MYGFGIICIWHMVLILIGVINYSSLQLMVIGPSLPYFMIALTPKVGITIPLQQGRNIKITQLDSAEFELEMPLNFL